MSGPSILERSTAPDEKNHGSDDYSERIKRARKAREAAEQKIRERAEQAEKPSEWVTEKTWRSR